MSACRQDMHESPYTSYANGVKDCKWTIIGHIIGLQNNDYPKGSEGYAALQALLKLMEGME